jgi:tRNA-2-methylthio-N6-dimethylallyladenosine synthase
MSDAAAPPRLRVPGAPLTFEPHAFSRPRALGRKHPPSGKRFHLWVSGCQMNVSDADYLAQGLGAAGFQAVDDLDEADLAILVTCCVRQNAEQKAYGRFRELKGWKQARPGRAIAMTGCMANKEKDRLYERLPDLDYRFDMRQYEAFIEDLHGEYETDPAQTGGAVLQHGLTAYVPVIFGCNEVCSFCIVPFVRGTERSRPLEDVVDDVRRFADQGVREVTLLGQTVNSYRDERTGARLATLLEAVGQVPGIWRVRFLTSHPRHLHDDLLFAIRDLPRVCEHLHLPFQSGDDVILKQMRRRYTRDEYRASIAHARSVVPDLSVSTDVIVGYPGETEEQFQRTLTLLEEIKFDVVHIQGFSPRPRTTAARQADDITPLEKKRRINVLLDAQRRIAEEANRRWINRTVEVLVERAQAGEISGRTRQNKVVIGSAPLGAEVGTVRLVRIEQATAWQLRGQLVH